VHSSGGTDVLTAWGFVAAAILMLLTILNLYGVSRLTKVNPAIVGWKIAIPLVTIVGVISYLSSFEGDQDTLKFGVDMLATAVLAVIVYVVAMHTRLSPEEARAYFDETEHEVESLESSI
jgi:amino acid transporter